MVPENLPVHPFEAVSLNVVKRRIEDEHIWDFEYGLRIIAPEKAVYLVPSFAFYYLIRDLGEDIEDAEIQQVDGGQGLVRYVSTMTDVPVLDIRDTIELGEFGGRAALFSTAGLERGPVAAGRLARVSRAAVAQEGSGPHRGGPRARGDRAAGGADSRTAIDLGGAPDPAGLRAGAAGGPRATGRSGISSRTWSSPRGSTCGPSCRRSRAATPRRTSCGTSKDSTTADGRRRWRRSRCDSSSTTRGSSRATRRPSRTPRKKPGCWTTRSWRFARTYASGARSRACSTGREPCSNPGPSSSRF